MDLRSVVVSQWSLRNPAQVAGMVDAISEGSLLPSIVLFENETGRIQILDGHHRACAYWLAGQRLLGYGEVIILPPSDLWRPQKGTVEDLVNRALIDQIFES